MTQRTCQTDAFRVVTGGDRPLPYHVLEMYPRLRRDPDPEPLFSHRLRPNSATSLEEIANTLERDRMITPAGFWRDRAADHARPRGRVDISSAAPEPGDRARPPHDEADTPGEARGTLSRLTWGDGGQRVDSPSPRREANLPHVNRMERFEQDPWQFQAGDTVLHAIDAHGTAVILTVEEGNSPVGLADDHTPFGHPDEGLVEGEGIDEPLSIPPASDEAGALSRVTYASGSVGLVEAEGLRIAQLDAASPARDEGAAIAREERLQGDYWVLHEPWSDAMVAGDDADVEPPGEPDQDRLRDRLMDRIATFIERVRDRFLSRDWGRDR